MRRDNWDNPVTWGFSMEERGMEKGDKIDYRGRRWRIIDYKVMVVDGHFALELYIQDINSKMRTDVITSADLVTAVEWDAPIPRPSTFTVIDAADVLKEKKKAYVLIYGADPDMWITNSGIAKNVDEILKRWAGPLEGGLPDTIDSVFDILPKNEKELYRDPSHPRFEYVHTKLTNEVLRRTRARFGIGCAQDPDMDHSQWALIEVDCKTGTSEDLVQS